MPSNVLGVYNPQFYANEGLIQLEKSLGMAARVHRGYDEERRSFGKGDTINIRRPSTFTTVAAPNTTAQDTLTETVQISLTDWREVKFALTDKELSYTGERIIQDHIRPASVALADYIDQQLCQLFLGIPWVYALTMNASTAAVIGDVTVPRRLLFDNAVPMDDLHYMVSGVGEQQLLGFANFSQWQGSGQAGVDTQLRGSIGTRYGMEFFANQNTPTYTSSTIADVAGAINNGAGYAKGISTINFDGVSANAAFKKGDTFVLSTHSQRYVLTADVTADGTGAATGAAISPPLAVAVADNVVMTFGGSTGAGNTTTQCLAFHRGAFAIAFAPLATIGEELGAKIAIATDPITGLSLRSRVYYMPDISEVRVCLDVLFGVKVLNPNMAVRAYHT